MKKQRAFQDTSMFSGFYEFCDESGNHYRAQNRDGNMFSVYALIDKAYVHSAIVKIEGKASPKKIYNQYLKFLDV